MKKLGLARNFLANQRINKILLSMGHADRDSTCILILQYCCKSQPINNDKVAEEVFQINDTSTTKKTAIVFVILF